MADINRFQNLPEYSHFEPAVVDTASMYAKMREAGVNDLLAKKQLSDQTKGSLDKVNQELYKFAPSESFLTLNTNSDVIQNPNRLYHEEFVPLVNNYNTALNEYYNKYKDNLSSVEAQNDYRKLQNLGSATVNRLTEVKKSDEARQKSDDFLLKWKSDTPLGDINGNVWSHNRDMLNSYSLGSKAPLMTTPLQPNKAINIEESIGKYIGDNGIQIIKDANLSKPEVDAAGGLIPYLKSGKITEETRKRLTPILDRFYNNWEVANKSLLENESMQRVYDNSLLGKDQSKNKAETHLQDVRNQYKNRFREFAISDLKRDKDLDYKLLSDEQAKSSGKGVYNILNGLTPMENHVMDNKNSSLKDFKLDGDKLGSTYKNLISFGGKTFINPTEAYNEMTKGKTYSPEVQQIIKDDINKIFNEEGVTGFKNQTVGANLASLGALLDKNEEGIKLPLSQFPKAEEASSKSIDLSNMSSIKDRIKRDPLFKQLLVDQNVDLNNPTSMAIKQAIKNDKEATDKLIKVATNGWAGEQLNSSNLNNKLNDALISSTVRLGKKETLDKSLKEILDSKNYSADGNSFKEVLNSEGKVENRTDNIIVGSGQSNTSVSLRRTAIIKDKEGKIIKEIPYIQDLSIPSINNNPTYKALNKLNELITSGQRVNDEFNGGVDLGNGFKAQLVKTYNPSTKTYDISGDVYDPNLGRDIPWDIFTQQVTKQAVSEVIKSSSILGGKESEKQQQGLLESE